MNWWLVWTVCTVIFIGCWIAFGIVPNGNRSEWFAAGAILFGAVSVFVWGGVGVRTIDRNQQGKACDEYALTSGFEQVQMLELSYWNYGCYVFVDGRWVEKGQIRLILEDA